MSKKTSHPSTEATTSTVAARVPTIEDRFLEMKQRAGMLARFLGAAAVENDFPHGKESSDAFYGFESVAQALYRDICAVDAALEQSPANLAMVPAPDVDDDEGGAR